MSEALQQLVQSEIGIWLLGAVIGGLGSISVSLGLAAHRSRDRKLTHALTEIDELRRDLAELSGYVRGIAGQLDRDE